MVCSTVRQKNSFGRVLLAMVLGSCLVLLSGTSCCAEMKEVLVSANGEYLGDGLYATFDGYQIELFAHDGIGKRGNVYLDPHVLANFLTWLQKMSLLKEQP